MTLVSHRPPLSKLCLPSALPLLQSPKDYHHNRDDDDYDNGDDYDDYDDRLILVLNVRMLKKEPKKNRPR